SLDPALWLPTTADEIRARGWGAPDVVFVTGDAYVDHPSFAMAVLSRVLESQGFRVAILPQPDWRSAAAWRALGRPRLFYAVSAGNMDSMINHYTANKKRRNDDAYSPGGRIGLRGSAYLLGARETPPVWPGETLVLPSLEDVTRDPMAFARMTRTFHHETNPFNAKRLTQAHGDRTLVLNPPCLPIGEAEMDA